MSPTNAVVTESVERRGDALGIQRLGRAVLGPLAEAIRVAPSANGHADLGALVEQGADLVEGHERLIFALGLRREQGRVGECRDDIVDAGGDGLVGESRRVISTSV